MLLAYEKFNINTSWIDKAKNLRNINHYLTFEKLLEKYALTNKIPKEVSSHFLINEFKNINSLKYTPSANGFYYFKNGKMTKISYSKSTYLFQLINKKENKKLPPFVFGTVAMQGNTFGKAKIIKLRKDYSKIKKGNIIILPMSTPDIIPFLKEVKGIITDEGGLTSHASIIAREMNIPCIVGTKTSTSIFKDNEMILLNATKGFAKKTKQKYSSTNANTFVL